MRRERFYLIDIVEARKKIERIVSEKNQEDILADDILFDAVVRNLQNIGEAARCLSPEVRTLRPHVEWGRIVGLRHILVHQYFGVDAEIVWDLATRHCPVLGATAESLLESLPDA